jgi:hypothetical protein
MCQDLHTENCMSSGPDRHTTDTWTDKLIWFTIITYYCYPSYNIMHIYIVFEFACRTSTSHRTRVQFIENKMV